MSKTYAIAVVCHEANRALQALQGDPSIPVSPPWDQCDAELHASAIDGVEAVLAGAGPRESHENWMRFKLAHGWTFGPVKDEAQKEHPLLVPYDDLPEEQRLKDDLFGAIVHALAGPQPRTRDEQARYDRARARFFTASEHPPVVALRDQIIGLGMLIDEHVPPGRNQALAYTHLEDVQMRGNRGIFAPEGLR